MRQLVEYPGYGIKNGRVWDLRTKRPMHQSPDSIKTNTVRLRTHGNTYVTVCLATVKVGVTLEKY